VLAVAGAIAALFAVVPAAHAYVYWSDNGQGIDGDGTTLGRANLDGNGVKGSLVNSAYGPGGIVSDGAHVYWAQSGPGGYSIGRANPDGSGANPTFISGPSIKAFALAVTSSYIYWTDGTQYIGRANLDGTGANAHFINFTSSHAPFGIAVSGGTLYVGEFGDIVTVPAVASNSPTLTHFPPFAGGSAIAVDIVVNDGFVYWAEFNTADPSSIGRAATNGTGFSEYFVPNLGDPTGVATDGTHLYWVDHQAGTIGRALITSGSPTNIQNDFITDSNGPWGVAIDSLVDPTATTVACSPATVPINDPSVCTASVDDSASSEVATGTVAFSGSASTFFPGGNTCTLTPRTGGGASCTVGVESASSGSQSVTGAYAGDPTHSSSNGTGTFCAGDSSVCGGGTGGGGTGTGGTGGGTGGGTSGGTSGGGTGGGAGGGPTTKVVCKVPKLKGKTLTQARRLLKRAHCRLGKVTRPHLRKGQKVALVIAMQKPKAGKTMPNGAKIAMRLIIKPHAKRR
jgi:hypothetical protein